MPNYFFKIGSYDLTPFIDIQSYLVNALAEYDEWTDADNTLHRRTLRKRCQGGFSVGFDSSEDFSAFLTELAGSVNSEGYYTASAYISNENAIRTIDVYLDLETTDDNFDRVNGRRWTVAQVTVMER